MISAALLAKATQTSLSADQKQQLGKLKDGPEKAQLQAQMEAQNYQNMVQFISNLMRIKADTSKAIISNMR